MSYASIKCDCAIFTSIRTPMGEGYRIIAASRGLRPNEKQVITRNSPSHNGTCTPPSSPGIDGTTVVGAAFYPLPPGRLCVALSTHAGAEHTGRGGPRVYTYNIVFDADDFPRCGFNAFNVLRAMVGAGLASPVLKPPPVLPELELTISDSPSWDGPLSLPPTFGSEFRRTVLTGLFGGEGLVVNVNIEGSWLDVAEALLLGVPGPLRAGLPFSTGLRFSVGRHHRLNLLYDSSNTTKSRIVGQPLRYLDPSASPQSAPDASTWVAFVDRHWETGDLGKLAARTSPAFSDPSPAGYERIARLYNDIDNLADMATGDLFSRTGDYVRRHVEGIEQDIVADFLDNAVTLLLSRLTVTRWAEAKSHWPMVLDIWQHTDRGGRLAQPLVHQLLRIAMADDPLDAAETALDAAHNIPAGANHEAHTALLSGVLDRWAEWVQAHDIPDPARFRRVLERWQLLQPQYPALERIHEKLAAPAPHL